MFITSYHCSNFFYGRKAASDDITNQKEDAAVLKHVLGSGGQKMLFSPEEDISFSPLSKLIEGKWRS